ncbi:hypothetical protein LPJ57_011323, partial [Coemansia sp. RSA 486]
AAQTIPQKNKADTSDSPALAKKQKLDPDAAGADTAGNPSVTDEQPKTVRAKGRQKSAGGSRKAARASNSPAVPAKPNPAAAQAAASSNAVAMQHQQQQQQPGLQIAVPGETALPTKSPAGPQPQTHVLPQSQPQQAGVTQLDLRPEALAHAVQQLAASPYAAILGELRNRGASAEDLRLFVILATQFQNPNRQQHERLDIKRQMDLLIARLRQNAGAVDGGAAPGASQGIQPSENQMAGVAPAGANVVQNTSQQQIQQPQQQQPQQQQPQQNMMSPAGQPAGLPLTVAQQLLQHTLNLVRSRLNIDIRQVFTMLTPDAFEAQVRE